MVVLGLLLIILGLLAILAGVTSSEGPVELLGYETSAAVLFVIGVAAGAAVLWGWSFARFGVRRAMQRRRERKQLAELSKKLDRADSGRTEEKRAGTSSADETAPAGDGHRGAPAPSGGTSDGTADDTGDGHGRRQRPSEPSGADDRG